MNCSVSWKVLLKTVFSLNRLRPNKDQLSRYTILGLNPDSIIICKNGRLVADGKTSAKGNPYEQLRQMMPQNMLANEFCGGLVGYLGYDAVNLFEPQLKLKTNPGFDTFRFGLYTDGIIHDHLTGETKYFYLLKNRLPQILKIAKQVNGQKPTIVKAQGSSLTKKQHAAQVKKVLAEVKAGNVFQCEVGMKNFYNISGSLLPLYARLREVNHFRISIT